MALRTIQRSYSDPKVRKSLFRVLRNNVLCSISTVTRGGRAHINTAYFAYSPDLELYFLSAPDSLHCRNLVANPSMAMTIFDSAQPWDRPGRGIQLFGTCGITRGREAERAERVYGGRFRAYAKVMSGTTRQDKRMARQLRSYRFYHFDPGRIKILDEAVFGGGVFVVTTVSRGRRRPR